MVIIVTALQFYVIPSAVKWILTKNYRQKKKLTVPYVTYVCQYLTVTICVLFTELQDGAQEDCGQDSPVSHKDIYENQIQISVSGVVQKYRWMTQCWVLLGCILPCDFHCLRLSCGLFNSASLYYNNWNKHHQHELAASDLLSLTINTRENKFYTLLLYFQE